MCNTSYEPSWLKGTRKKNQVLQWGCHSTYKKKHKVNQNHQICTVFPWFITCLSLKYILDLNKCGIYNIAFALNVSILTTYSYNMSNGLDKTNWCSLFSPFWWFNDSGSSVFLSSFCLISRKQQVLLLGLQREHKKSSKASFSQSGRCGVLMVCMLDSGSSGPVSSSGQGLICCVLE